MDWELIDLLLEIFQSYCRKSTIGLLVLLSADRETTRKAEATEHRELEEYRSMSHSTKNGRLCYVEVAGEWRTRAVFERREHSLALTSTSVCSKTCFCETFWRYWK